jgi:hypothetical protein
MDKPGDPNERLRKAQEEARRKYKARREVFLPYRTMFKLSLLRPGMARGLECVACGIGLEWRIYAVAPEKFDTQCPECGVEARDYWDGRPSQEINDGSDTGREDN